MNITRLKSTKWPLLIVFLAGVTSGVGLGVALSVDQDLPQIQALEIFEPTSATRLWSADGQVLAEFFVEKRLPLSLESIPLAMRQAVVAVEDRRFYRHPGLDVIRSVGALLRDIQAGRMIQGGSTITQQLARNLYLTSEKTLSRKLKEMYLALQIERVYTKEEILKLYLNQIYFGAGAYGVGAAAEVYFNKPAKNLTLDECLLLAGLIQSPEGHSPFKSPERALARRKIVCNAMVREGFLSSEQAMRECQKPLKLSSRPVQAAQAPDFVIQVLAELILMFGENQVYKGGLQVKTTLNLKDQQLAEKALTNGLERLERAGSKKTPLQPPGRLQGGLLALSIPDSQVLVWTGMMDDQGSRLAPSGPILGPPGQTIKPFIYAAAIESGLSQADLIWDAPVSYQLPGRDAPWQPHNSNRRYEGEITLRRSLETLANIPAIKLLSRIGLDNFMVTAQKLGLTTPLEPSLLLAMGTSPINMWELTSAYQALANHGLWTEPRVINEVRDQSGRVLYEPHPNRRAAVSPEASFVITDMLMGAYNAAASRLNRSSKQPLAGAGGVTENGLNAAFAGYSPEICAGIWVGFTLPPEIPDGYGAQLILPIWLDFMTHAQISSDRKEFDRPQGVVLKYMDRYNGRSARPEEANAVEAAFKVDVAPKGTQP